MSCEPDVALLVLGGGELVLDPWVGDSGNSEIFHSAPHRTTFEQSWRSSYGFPDITPLQTDGYIEFCHYRTQQLHSEVT